MKVILFSHEFPPYIGGVGRIGYDLLQLYTRTVGVEASLVTRSKPTPKLINRVKVNRVFTLPKIWFLNYALFYFFNRRLFREADVIYLNEAAPTIAAGMFFSKSDLSKCVIIAHGLEVEGVINSKQLVHRVLGLSRFYKRAVRISKKVVALSEAMRAKMCRALPSDYRRFIDVAYLGIDPEIFHYKPTLERDQRFQSVVESKVIGTCSRLIWQKGYKEMADTFAMAHKKDSSLLWYIAGDGEDALDIKDYIKFLGLENSVTFLGAFDYTELSSFYSFIDIFMLLSNYDEVFPLVYLEAQACGARSIGRNKGGTVEVVDLNTGCLVDDNIDAASFILSCPKNFDRKKVIEFTENFIIRENFKKWRDICEGL
ncbi:glycosyltransferase family 4 protein [Bermanella marisrubri]|uniref:Glycosyltransferase n=1 Tax=Bermanella marisrubri TaxID=207949 RepID=Q1N4G3_9GAMM|nr:glycosyltransferase family 4 protein [Bermanella marisrubri]EAT13140.1 hypothetical protein RED65_00230 [Oceanobacter sp. RED65] [Bermanella marisrubri]QIZ83916.1 glycosyltransferase family 4 protein [Bermanella marisrubri]